MGCCFGNNDDEKQNSTTPIEVVPANDRQCRDVFFALLFVAFWVGMVVVGGQGLTKGNPSRLSHGLDDKGRWCGEGNMTDFPYLYFPDITTVDYRECVSSCWTQEEIQEFYGDDELAFEMGRVCQKRNAVADDFDPAHVKREATRSIVPQCIPGTDRADDQFYRPYDSFPLLNFCVPAAAKNVLKIKTSNSTEAADQTSADHVSALLNSGASNVTRLFSDLKTAYWVVIVCAFAALIFGFIWLFLLKTFSKFFVWITALSMVIVTVLFTVWLYHTADQKDKALTEESTDSQRNTAKALKYISYGCAGVAFLLTCVIIFMRKRIQITAAVIEEASRAIGSMPMIVFYPLTTFFLSALLFIYWIAVAVFLASAGSIGLSDKCAEDATEATCIYRQYLFDTSLRYMVLYHLFGLLWTLAFILALGEMVIAGAIANWYWSDDKKIGTTPVLTSFKQCFRYYIGTLALGSLIIAIVQFMRIMLEYIDQQAKKYPENKFVKAVICCLRCCFYCLEKCIRFINRNAYIMVSVYGEGFCASAKSAFMLILENAARVAAVNFFGDFLLFLGKLIVAGAAGFIGFLILDNSFTSEEISSVFFPTLVIVIMCYGIASGFMSVYEMSIDTILLCFCKDCDIHNNNPRYCSNELKEILGTAGQEMKKKDDSSSVRR